MNSNTGRAVEEEFIVIGQTHVEVLIIKRTVDVPHKIATKAKCDAH